MRPFPLRSLCATLLLSALILIASGQPARADAPPPAPPHLLDELHDHFWLNIHDPDQFIYEQLMVHTQLKLKAQRISEALELMEAAIKRAPWRPEAHYIAGSITSQLKRYEEAIGHFLTHREKVPDADQNFGICFELALAYSHLERWDETIQEYQRCLAVTPQKDFKRRVIYFGNMAETLMATGDLDGAVQAYREALALDKSKNRVHALLGLGVALERQGKTTEARAILREGLAMDPALEMMTGDGVFFIPDGDQFFHLGLMLEELGRIADARLHYKRFLNDLPDSPYRAQAEHNLKALDNLESPTAWVLSVPTSRVTAAVVDSQLSMMALGSAEGRISLVDFKTGEVLNARLKGPGVVDIAFTPKNKELRVMLNTGEILRFNPKGLRPKKSTRLGKPTRRRGPRSANSLSADGSRALITHPKGFEIWSLDHPSSPKFAEIKVKDLPAPLFMAATDPKGRVIFTSHNQRGRIHNLSSKDTSPPIKTSETSGILDAEVSPDASFVAAATPKGLLLLNTQTGAIQKLLLPYGKPIVQALTLDTSGRYLTAVLKTHIQVFDLQRLDKLPK